MNVVDAIHEISTIPIDAYVAFNNKSMYVGIRCGDVETYKLEAWNKCLLSNHFSLEELMHPDFFGNKTFNIEEDSSPPIPQMIIAKRVAKRTQLYEKPRTIGFQFQYNPRWPSQLNIPFSNLGDSITDAKSQKKDIVKGKLLLLEIDKKEYVVFGTEGTHPETLRNYLKNDIRGDYPEKDQSTPQPASPHYRLMAAADVSLYLGSFKLHPGSLLMAINPGSSTYGISMTKRDVQRIQSNNFPEWGVKFLDNEGWKSLEAPFDQECKKAIGDLQQGNVLPKRGKVLFLTNTGFEVHDINNPKEQYEVTADHLFKTGIHTFVARNIGKGYFIPLTPDTEKYLDLLPNVRALNEL